ncbi:MAG: NAD-binding protein [Pseudomonadota bacterium]
MRERLIIASLVPLLIAIGLWGQYQISAERLTERFGQSLYEVIILFAMGGEWTLALEDVPIAIEFARFAAPMVAIASLLLLFAVRTRTTLANFLVRFSKNHVVVVGLSENSWQFLRTCESGSSIVVFEVSGDNPFIERARNLGFPVLTGDLPDERLFQRLNLQRASNLIAFSANDGANIELTVKARNWIREYGGQRPHLRMHVHLNEIGLASQLEDYPKFFADFSLIEISFFSVYDLSARLLLRDYPPEIFADVAGQERVHLCIYGFSQLAVKLIIEAAQVCHYANGGRLRLTVFDTDADNRALRMRSAYPNLIKICDLCAIELPAFGPHVFNGEFSRELPSITQHILCLESDEENLNFALMLRRTLLAQRSTNAPILVRMQQSSGLAQLLESNTGEPEVPDGLYPFGMLDQILSADNILTSQLDQLAHTIHDMYLNAAPGGDPRAHQALQGWEELPQWERKQNLLKADHWPIRLRAVRLADVPGDVGSVELTPEEAEVHAMMEHNRYVSNKLFDGWTHGDVRLEEAKVNPFLVHWRDLPPQQREKEISEALAIPGQFASRASRSARRIYVLGASGHRLNKLDVDSPILRQRIIDALDAIAARNPGYQFVVLSPLAEGADRLVAQLAMDKLNAALNVPLPLPYELYTSDFTSADSMAEFRQMIGHASLYFELPMRFGNIRELAAHKSETRNEARNRQYALAGAYIVQRSDCLLAVYDGKNETSTGGTGQVIRWYKEGIDDPDYLYRPEYFIAPRHDPIVIVDSNTGDDAV